MLGYVGKWALKSMPDAGWKQVGMAPGGPVWLATIPGGPPTLRRQPRSCWRTFRSGLDEGGGKGQIVQALPSGGESRIGRRRANKRHAGLVDPDGYFARGCDVYFDLGHLGDP